MFRPVNLGFVCRAAPESSGSSFYAKTAIVKVTSVSGKQKSKKTNLGSIWAMVNTHYMVDGHPIHNKDPYNGYYKSLWTVGWLAPINGYYPWVLTIAHIPRKSPWNPIESPYFGSTPATERARPRAPRFATPGSQGHCNNPPGRCRTGNLPKLGLFRYNFLGPPVMLVGL